MKVKPKEVLVNLPIALTFDDINKIPEFAANINTLIHGKVKIKYEELGALGGQHVGLFYINRNDEFTELREDFMNMIEAEEVTAYIPPKPKQTSGAALQEAVATMQNEGGTPSGAK